MKLFSKHEWGKRFTQALARFGFMKIPSGFGGMASGGLLGFSRLGNRRKQVEAYQSHVYKCVTLIYRRAISVSMKLYKERGDEDEEVKKHIFLDLMRKPNPYMTGKDLKALAFMHRDLTGMAFWLKTLNRLGRPVELWPLPVANFSRFIFNDSKTELLKYEFRTDDGRPVQYDPEEIVYFRYPHPLYFFEGASPVQAMAYAYDTDLAIRIYQRNFFQNSARPDVVFETEQGIQPEDAKRLLINWKVAHQGVEKAWEPALLDKGLKAKILSVAAKDFEFAVLAGWTKEDILEAYNVPPGKLGTVKDVNKANALGIDITFNSECIAPRLESYEDQINLNLLPLYDAGLYVEHVNCIPRDKDFELKERETNLKTGLTTINEERAGLGKEPVSWGDVAWMPVTQLPATELGAALEGEEAGDKKVQGSEVQGSTVLTLNDEPGTRNKDRRQRLWQAFAMRTYARERPFKAALKRFFRKQKKVVLENLEQIFPKVEGLISGMSVAKISKTLTKARKDLVDEILFNFPEEKDLLKRTAKPFIEGTFEAAGIEALSSVGIDMSFNMSDPLAEAWLAKRVPKLAEEVNLTTMNQLRIEMVEGFQLGESVQQIAKRIEKVYEHADRVRSMRIARTETVGADNEGTLQGYKQSKVVKKKEWLAGGGARPTHAQAGMEYRGDGAIPLDEDFYVGAGHGRAPGQIGLAEEDIN